MIAKMLEALQKESNLDAIIVPGDLVGHNIPLEPTDPTKGDYDLLKSVLKSVSGLF